MKMEINIDRNAGLPSGLLVTNPTSQIQQGESLVRSSNLLIPNLKRI